MACSEPPAQEEKSSEFLGVCLLDIFKQVCHHGVKLTEEGNCRICRVRADCIIFRYQLAANSQICGTNAGKCTFHLLSPVLSTHLFSPQTLEFRLVKLNSKA